jgi:hypothetical protein
MLLRFASSEAAFAFPSDDIDGSEFVFSVALPVDSTMEPLSWGLKAFSMANGLGWQTADSMRLLSSFCSKNSDWGDGEGVMLSDKYGGNNIPKRENEEKYCKQADMWWSSKQGKLIKKDPEAKMPAWLKAHCSPQL